MIAVDTNVLVRYVTNDDPEQAKRAKALLAGPETILVVPTVLLELEWVLRAVYELPRSAIRTAMLQVLGLRTVRIDQAQRIARAISGYEAGLDFADVLHLELGADAQRLFTFDRRFVARAKQEGLAVDLL